MNIPVERDTQMGTEVGVVGSRSGCDGVALFNHGFGEELSEGAEAYYAYLQGS